MGETFGERVARTLAENRPGAATSPAPTITTGRSGMATNVPPGAPPLPAGSITSDHRGDSNDDIRTALMALQKWLEQNQDDQDALKVQRCIVALQGVLADHASGRDA